MKAESGKRPFVVPKPAMPDVSSYSHLWREQSRNEWNDVYSYQKYKWMATSFTFFFLSVPFLVQVGPMHNTWSMRKCNGQMGTTRFPKVAKILEKILAIPEPIDFANGIIMATWHHVTRSFPKNSQNTNEIRMFISTNLGHKICPKLPENWLNKSHGNSKWQHGKLKMKTFDYSTEWGF